MIIPRFEGFLRFYYYLPLTYHVVIDESGVKWEIVEEEDKEELMHVCVLYPLFEMIYEYIDESIMKKRCSRCGENMKVYKISHTPLMKELSYKCQECGLKATKIYVNLHEFFILEDYHGRIKHGYSMLDEEDRFGYVKKNLKFLDGLIKLGIVRVQGEWSGKWPYLKIFIDNPPNTWHWI